MNKLFTALRHIEISGQSFGCDPNDVVALIGAGAIVRATDRRSSNYDVTARGQAFLAEGAVPSRGECGPPAVAVYYRGCAKVVTTRCKTVRAGACYGWIPFCGKECWSAPEAANAAGSQVSQ